MYPIRPKNWLPTCILKKVTGSTYELGCMTRHLKIAVSRLFIDRIWIPDMENDRKSQLQLLFLYTMNARVVV